jgi:predicted ATPase
MQLCIPVDRYQSVESNLQAIHRILHRLARATSEICWTASATPAVRSLRRSTSGWPAIATLTAAREKALQESGNG